MPDYSKVHARLKDFVNTPHNWDDNDGKPANPEVAECVTVFLKQVEALGVCSPSLSLSTSGCVSVIWHSKTHRAYASFIRTDVYNTMFFAKHGAYSIPFRLEFHAACETRALSLPFSELLSKHFLEIQEK